MENHIANLSKYAPKVESARKEILNIDRQAKVARIFATMPILGKIHDRLIAKRASLLASNHGRRAIESLRKEGYTN